MTWMFVFNFILVTPKCDS